MATREPFAIGEWYHCFNRGVDKRVTFETERDYERFLQVLYLCNSVKPIHRSDLIDASTERVLKTPRSESLVEIGAFCLMPNHFHLLLKEVRPGGITTFMRKVGTAYTMYFNIKKERTGNLFMRPFRSKHVNDDLYFQHSINYIHCNPAELFEHSWKNGVVKNLNALQRKLVNYPYTSFGAYTNKNNILRALLGEKVFDVAEPVSATKMLKEAQEYYLSIGKVTP